MEQLVEQLDFVESKKHTGLYSCSTSNLASSESTITTVSSSKSLMSNKRDLRSYFKPKTSDRICDLSEELYYNMLSYQERLIPTDIIRGSTIFTDNHLIPEAILNLADDIAVRQLIKTLISISSTYQCGAIKYIRLSTRSEVEKREIMAKIDSAIKNNQHMFHNRNRFHGPLSIDASSYPASTAENQLQKHICQLLQLPVIQDNEISYTRHIEKEMSINRYLVLLVDKDIGETVDLQKMGFNGTSFRGVLVLITSDSIMHDKDEELLPELMDLEIRTRDHLLSWNLFCHNVGKEFVYASSAILTIATRIVEECRGHLLAIVLVAKWLLKNPQDVKHWEHALHKMLHTDPTHDIQGHFSTVMKNTFLNLIWDNLNISQKHCLLRCLFIPRISYGRVDHEVIDDWVYSLIVNGEETKQNLRHLLDIFVLLQFERSGSMYVQLPVEIYKILQSINISNPLAVDKSGLGLTELLDTDQWHSALQVKLANNKLSELPLSPNSPELKVLMLQHNVDLTKIPSSFFFHMPLLCILNLSYTSVRELPLSLFFLVQLKKLYLKGCECFMKLPHEIGNLKKLEKLDLDETQITHLPEEVQNLTCLQSLTLYFYEYRSKKNKSYSCSTIIPSGVLSKLKMLKHLNIGVNPDDERWHDNVEFILPEILELKLIQTLSIYIPQLELLKLIPSYFLEGVDFRFIVGCHMQRIMSSIPPEVDATFKQSDCSLNFVKGDDVPTEVKKLVRHSKALYLDRHSTIKNLSEFKMENLEQLRVCILAECKEMQTVVGGGSNCGNDDGMLSHLLLLSISHMKNLRSIWEGPTPPHSLFGMLRSLSVQSCPKLITLFSLDFVGNLSLLKNLVVKDCPKLTSLIKYESSSKRGTFLPKLRKLSLLHLPELTSISNGLHIGACLKEVAFYDCPKLLRLSRMELSGKELVAIKGETNWWNTLNGRTSKLDEIFIPIHEEADLITQLGVYDHENNIAKGPETCWTLPKHAPSGPVGKSSQPITVSRPRPVSLASSWKNSIYIKHRSSQRWEIFSSSLEDEYSWRKYGQKEILNSKYPRAYYRCTHGNVQGCPALKQVHRDDEDPSSFRITYRGHHTCNALKGRTSSLNKTSIPINEDADVIAAACDSDGPAVDNNNGNR